MSETIEVKLPEAAQTVGRPKTDALEGAREGLEAMQRAIAETLGQTEGWCKKCAKEKTCTYPHWSEWSLKCRDFQPKVFADQNGFMECPTCAAKPGSPDLCPSCLRNRDTISTLRQVIDLLWDASRLKDEAIALLKQGDKST